MTEQQRMEQRERDTIVERQRYAWEVQSERLALRLAAEMAPVQVESRTRPGVVYQSMAFLQSRVSA